MWDARLDERIAAPQASNVLNATLGSGKTWRLFNTEDPDQPVARRAVERRMRSLGLRGIGPGRSTRTTRPAKRGPHPQDLLGRDHAAERADERWGPGASPTCAPVLGGLAGLLGSLVGPFVLDVADRQPQELDGGVIAGEVAAVLGDLAQLVVQRLDGVGGVDDPAQGRGEDQEGREPLPGPLPGLRRLGYFAPRSLEAKSSRALQAASASGAV